MSRLEQYRAQIEHYMQAFPHRIDEPRGADQWAAFIEEAHAYAEAHGLDSVDVIFDRTQTLLDARRPLAERYPVVAAVARKHCPLTPNDLYRAIERTERDYAPPPPFHPETLAMLREAGVCR